MHTQFIPWKVALSMVFWCAHDEVFSFWKIPLSESFILPVADVMHVFNVFIQQDNIVCGQ